MRLEGKVALITVAAAAVPGELMGFGGAAALLFLREGARVVISDVRDELGERAAARTAGDRGRRALSAPRRDFRLAMEERD